MLEFDPQISLKTQNINGLISIERFTSLVEEGKVLFLSFWRDEKAIQEWRNVEAHRLAREKGRKGVFSNYRLRVANMSRDYGIKERTQAPSDSKKIYDK